MVKQPYLCKETPILRPIDVVIQLPPMISGIYFTHKSQFSESEPLPVLFRQKIQYPEASFVAIMVVTNYRVLILQKVSDTYFVPVISMPYGLILNVDKIGGQKFTRNDQNYGIRFTLKSPFSFIVQLDRTLKIRKTLYSSLLNHLQIDQKFSTSFISTVLKQRVNVNGWQLYDPVYEYLRMGVETNIVLKSLYQCKFQVKRITKYFPNLHQNEQMSFLASNPQVIQSIEDDTISQPTNENILQPTAYNYQEDPRLPETPGFVMQQYNYDYSVCETYPALLAFPGFLTITQIKQVAQFRSSQRLPALLWTMSNMPCIIRCSQPCQGLKGEASIVDKQMINGFCCKRYPKSIIFDARAQLNVQVNQIMGKGVEKIEEYESVERVVYLGMDNIHVVRQAFLELREAMQEQVKINYKRSQGFELFTQIRHYKLTDEEVLQLNPKLIQTYTQAELIEINCSQQQNTKIDDHSSETDAISLNISLDNHTANFQKQKIEPLILGRAVQCNQQIINYLHHIQTLMQGAYLIKLAIRQGRNAIIHCSDGWDRTPQLTSLAQLAIDPYYRTCRGFAILIQKEFLSFGHRFGTRNNLFMYTSDQKEQAPIFFMFLEAVYNVIKQNVEQFEFDQDFLLYLAFQCWNRQTGTFLFDCECDRQVNMAQQLSNSVFDDVDQWKVREAQGGEVNIQVEQTTLWWDWWGQHM
ncbi:Myotubularin-like_protein [Hexamita inflata]|uniref:Myotubularin-like_protein n=1 Tax=Hexamita inflata TaxID=28002 RepID=A0ABP1HWZ8_9EUKA